MYDSKLISYFLYLFLFSLVLLPFKFARIYIGNLYVPLTVSIFAIDCYFLYLKYCLTGQLKTGPIILLWASFGFFISLIFSILGEEVHISRIVEFTFYLFIPLIFINLIDTWNTLKNCLIILVIVGLIIVVIDWYFFFVERGIYCFTLGSEIGGLSSRNAVAFMIEPAFIITLTYWLVSLRMSRSIALLAVFSIYLLAIGIILTSSRGGWISTSIGVVSLLFFTYSKEEFNSIHRVIRIILVFITVTTVFVYLSHQLSQSEINFFQNRLKTLKYFDPELISSERWQLINDSFIFMINHPFKILKGVGVANFANYIKIYSRFGSLIEHAHVTFINIFIEQGIIGIISFSILLFGAIYYLWRAKPDRDNEWIVLSLFITLIVYSCHLLVSCFYNYIFFWIVYGLSICAYNCSNDICENEDDILIEDE